MRFSRIKIIDCCIFIFAIITLSCKEKIKNKEDIRPVEGLIKQWTSTEVLNQKYTAERKYHDTTDCIVSNDSLTLQQKDSVLKIFSQQPEILKEIVSHALENEK